MLLTKTTTVKWAKRNKDYYIDKGYHFTDYGDQFHINIHDLSTGSSDMVEFECDNCHTTHKIQWRTYKKKVYKELCIDCAKKRIHEKWQKMDDKIDNFKKKRREAYLKGDIY